MMSLRSVAFVFLFCGFFHCASHASDSDGEQTQAAPLITSEIVNDVVMGDHSLRILSEQCSEFKVGIPTYCATAYFTFFLAWHIIAPAITCTSDKLAACIFLSMESIVLTLFNSLAVLVVVSHDLLDSYDDYSKARDTVALINDAIRDDEHVDGPIKACVKNYEGRHPSRTVNFKDVTKKIRMANQALYFVDARAFKGCGLDKDCANRDDLPSTEIFAKEHTGIFDERSVSHQKIVDALIDSYSLETLESDREAINVARKDYENSVKVYLEQVRKNSPVLCDDVDAHSDAKINVIAVKGPHLDLDVENLLIGSAAYNLKYLRDGRPNSACRLYAVATVGTGLIMVAIVLVDSSLCSLTNNCMTALVLTSFFGKLAFLGYSFGSVWAIPASLKERALNKDFYELVAGAHKIDDVDDDNNMTVKLFEEFRERNPSLKVDLAVLMNALQKMNAAGYFLPRNKLDHTASCFGACNRFEDQPELAPLLRDFPTNYVDMAPYDLVNDILKNSVPVDLDEHVRTLPLKLQEFQKALDDYADLLEQKK